MDNSFEETYMEQWTKAEEAPFEEMDILPVPSEIDEELAFLAMLEAEEKAEAEKAERKKQAALKEAYIQGAVVQQEDAAGEVTDEDMQPEPEESEEEKKRAEHEALEAKRKAEWEAKKQEKLDAEKRELERINSMSDEELMAASMKRISKDTELLTRRNMKECVSEHVQSLCLMDTAFARLTMHPKKNMINCFQYINRKAREFVEQELKNNGEKMEWGKVYGSDVPDELCYKWAEEYFKDPDALEDKPEKEEKFEPIPYKGTSVNKISTKKTEKKVSVKKMGSVNKKEDMKKTEESKAEKKEPVGVNNDDLTGQMSLMDFMMSGEDTANKAS